jgi:crotonobetainyl-CoA:carnitine CoA-transferase CaiB-like acyl-CoA transferase
LTGDFVRQRSGSVIVERNEFKMSGMNSGPSGRLLGAMTGIRVIDSSQVGAGPYLASLLGDLGADVIKVEPPEGEPFRRIDADFGLGASSYFFGMNRSKRSVTLDLKSADGGAAFRRLVSTADVLIVSMRPAALKRLGIDYESLAAPNPGLVYCAITAFGESGPRANQPGMDILAQALSGIMGTTGEKDREPVKVGAAVSDFATSFIGGFAICAALLAKQRDGLGQKISLSLLDSSIALMANYVTAYYRTHELIRPLGSAHPQLVPYQVFRTADGHLVVACLNDRFWPPLCNAIGRPDLGTDPRFLTNSDRVRNRNVLIPFLDSIFAGKQMAEWITCLREQDVPCSPVHRLEDVFNDPQVIHNEMLLELEHPEFGRYQTTNNPIRMSRTPTHPNRYAPALGEHNREVLADLGFSPPEIERLTGRSR